MGKIIVFTDLHIIPEGQSIIGLDPYERLLKGVEHAMARHPDADRVVCTGDLTNRGDAESYARLHEILSRCPMPVRLMVGNHDEREGFVESNPDTLLDENGFVQSAEDLGGWRLIYLDTLNGPPYIFPETYSGYLCELRLAWLDRQLAEAAEKPVALFMHHPPHDVGFQGMDEIKLKNGAALYDLIERHGNVRHIIAGHVHRTISGAHRGVPFSIFKSPVHQQPMDLISKDLSLSVDEPGAYGILLTTPDGIIAHTEDYELATAQPRSDQAALGAGADAA